VVPKGGLADFIRRLVRKQLVSSAMLDEYQGAGLSTLTTGDAAGLCGIGYARAWPHDGASRKLADRDGFYRSACDAALGLPHASLPSHVPFSVHKTEVRPDPTNCCRQC